MIMRNIYSLLQNICYGILILFSCSLFACCSSHEIYRPTGPSLTGYDFTHYNRQHEFDLPATDEKRKYAAEEEYVKRLEENIAQNKDVEKNKARLQQAVNDLQQSFNERVSARSSFLNEFYQDLYRLGTKEFSNKYKKHCSRELLKCMKNIYKMTHENDGYAWVLFGDNQHHQANDFSIVYLNGQRNNMDEKSAAYLDLRFKGDKYPYYNKEDNWYQVGMSDNNVYVKVEGEGKHIAITGIYNPVLNFTIKTYYDR